MNLDVEEVLFSIKCFAAGMLAFYISLRIGLVRPYWAVGTSYVVSQLLAGGVISKAVFRLVGTCVGAVAAVTLVPIFVNAPFVLSLALAMWLALCVYVAVLDRTPRAYMYLLAGTTATIIGFPSVTEPTTIFTTAILRVEEIAIGILCSSLFHAAVFPRTVSARVISRVDTIVSDVTHWIRESLDYSQLKATAADRRRLALDLEELDHLSVLLPFDTGSILPRVRTLRALQDQILQTLPLISAIEDRLATLKQVDGISKELSSLIADLSEWLTAAAHMHDRTSQATALTERIKSKSLAANHATSWPDLLELNLRACLADIIEFQCNVYGLIDQLRNPEDRSVGAAVKELIARTRGRAVHRDRWLASRHAVGTFFCVVLASTFWISSGWTYGAGSVLLAGVCCALFAPADRPGALLFQYFLGSAAGLLMSMIYAYTILPRATGFEMFVAAMAPLMLFCGSMLARQSVAMVALGAILEFTTTVGFVAQYTPDFSNFANSAISQLIGTGVAVVVVRLFQGIGISQSVARLNRLSWRDVARRADGRSTDEIRWASRMLDRAGLLLPRLTATSDTKTPPALFGTLMDMRIGIVAGRLRHLYQASEYTPLGDLLNAIARYFDNLNPSHPTPVPPTLLASIDSCIHTMVASPNSPRAAECLVLLTALRRNLFPTATCYEARV
ncbi:fusaric acid resistance protein [Burkholderia lata]|uniref:Fusaric acid resistance protein n=1 Tax=Burkholderia lata (strain ATCC 17760 / DSM 23089 / LMG 22485 / NCIMB 9086 / R18194 / 383) TaxID=482957 RepID=A0A6P2UQU0_BURL3|nr:FUSC family protein [Burkholderia lata]VWC77401.1 fusaric acid resistance protein [Burkholderia lata]